MTAPAPETKDPAGAAWVHCYLPSVSVDDLLPAFAAQVHGFINSLVAGGATVHINDTYRPAERAYLMHWSCMIALSGQDPAEVPPMAGVAIDWSCGGNNRLAKLRAAEMIAAYGIKFPAALVSRHTQRRAIDMNVIIPPRPTKLYTFVGGDNETYLFGSGDLPALYKLGASFGVIHLAGDAPHWSDDGH